MVWQAGPPTVLILLSQLLDDVVGSEEMVRIRRDYCRIYDCILSAIDANNDNTYFTGSRAEGLYLPGSDLDFMMDFNNWANLFVIQKCKIRQKLPDREMCSI